MSNKEAPLSSQPDCKNHKKDVAGISDMKVLAEMIGDLHYETLADLFDKLQNKLLKDAANDRRHGRVNLSDKLDECASYIGCASWEMTGAWKISKPFMK